MEIKFFAVILTFLNAWCSIATVAAQEIVAETELNLHGVPSDKVSIDKVQLDKDGNYLLYASRQFLNSVNGGDTLYSPALQLIKLGPELEVQNNIIEKYTVPKGFAAGATYSVKGEPRPKSYQEMLRLYPAFFQGRQKAERHSYQPAFLGEKPLVFKTKKTYEYDVLSNTHSEIVRQNNIYLNLPPYNKGMAYIHDEIRFSEKAGIISLVLSNKLEEDDTNQLMFQNQTIITFDFEGKQLARYHLAFDYPSEVRFHQFMEDWEGKSGKVAFIFGPARLFGFKMTDPDPHNYQIVVINNKGDRVFDHKFRYGIGGGASIPLYAFTHNQLVYVLGKGLGKYPDYHLLVFDSEGLKKTTLIDPETLYSHTWGEYDAGLRKDFASTFDVRGFVVSNDGGFLVYGEHKSNVKRPTVDAATKKQVSAVYEYPSYTFLQFDREGNFKQNYVIEKSDECNALNTAKIKFLFADKDKVHFWLSETLAAEAPLYDFQRFMSGDRPGARVNKNYTGDLETSRILTIDSKAQQANELSLGSDFVNIEGQEFFILDQKKKELLLIGANREESRAFLLILKKVKF